MKTYNRINSRDIKIGMRFSAPVFFEDGENMFLAEEKSVKPYHIAALARWDIPYVLTYGHEIVGHKERQEGAPADFVYDLEEVEELQPLDVHQP